MEKNPETKTLIPLRSPQEALALLGHGDKHLKTLRKLLPAQLVVRGQEMQISGPDDDVRLAERVVRDLITLVRQGAEIDAGTLEQVILVAEGGQSLPVETASPALGQEIALPGRLKPKTPGQRQYVEAIAANDITLGIGPAGTGKSYLAVAMAVAYLKAKKVKRIILTRPAVEAGERLGFLPGDLQAKIDPYLRPLYDALFEMIDAERFDQYLQAGIIEVAPLAFMRGRAQPLTSKVLTPLGWREMGSLEPGDYVIGSSGKPTQITGVFPQGEKEVFKLTMSDGSSTLACAEHLWAVYTASDKRRNKPARVLQTQEMMGNLKASHQYRYELPLMSAPAHFPSQPVPLDPYAVGLLLGGVPIRAHGPSPYPIEDGCITGKTTPTFTSADPELVVALVKALEPQDIQSRQKTSVLDYRQGGCGEVMVVNPRTVALRELNLEGTGTSTRFIPQNYLYNSPEVRLAVLQGLLDTGGSATRQRGRSRVQYTTTSAQLCQDVTFLVQSLGGTVTSRVRAAEGREPGLARGREVPYRHNVFVLELHLPPGMPPFRLTRKAEAYAQTATGRPMRFIRSIEPAGTVPTQCISVAASDRLYVTDDFIVTHNTLNDAFIILDEAQNTTPEQMKMFLTRMGFNSKVVITGDVTQIDLPKMQKSGLMEAMRILKNIQGIHMQYFRESDVVRHPLVARIVKAYEQAEHEREEGSRRQGKPEE